MSQGNDNQTVGRFVLKVLIWLPLAFLVWYMLAGPLLWPMRPLLDFGFGSLSQFVDHVRLVHGQFIFETTLEVKAPDGRTGLAVVEVNALKYTYNLPLLVALLYAASDKYFTFTRLAAIYLLLLPFQLWGVSFDFLSQLVFHAGPDVARQVGIEGMGRELVALGYQFGYLMLPPISAAAIWFLLNRDFVLELLGMPSDGEER